MARAYCRSLPKDLGSTTIDPARCQYPLGISPFGYAVHGPSCHLPSPLLYCPSLVWCYPIPGAPASSRSSDLPQYIGHPGPPSDDFWGGSDGPGGLPSYRDPALSADRGVLPRDVHQRQRVSTAMAVLMERESPLHPFPLQLPLAAVAAAIN